MQASLGVPKVRIVAGEVPNDKGFVTAAREEHVGVLQARS